MKRYRVARRRSFGGKARRFGRKAGAFMKTDWGMLASAAVYGAVRSKITQALEPVSSKLPFGEYSDEAVLIGGALLVKHFVGRKNKMVNNVCNAILIVEAASVGAGLASGMGFNSGGGSVDPTMNI